MDIAEQILEFCAQAAHEINRAYCQAIGDDSQVVWSEAPEWQKTSAILGARKVLEDPLYTPEKSHEMWLAHKKATGWTYGETKDPEKKTHPCMLPFSDLPSEMKVKDVLFVAVVRHTAKQLQAAMTAGFSRFFQT